MSSRHADDAHQYLYYYMQAIIKDIHFFILAGSLIVAVRRTESPEGLLT